MNNNNKKKLGRGWRREYITNELMEKGVAKEVHGTDSEWCQTVGFGISGT